MPLETCGGVMRATYLKDSLEAVQERGGGRGRESIKESLTIFPETDGLLSNLNRGMTKTLCSRCLA